jgi:predicted transcriptional regulator
MLWELLIYNLKDGDTISSLMKRTDCSYSNAYLNVQKLINDGVIEKRENNLLYCTPKSDIFKEAITAKLKQND